MGFLNFEEFKNHFHEDYRHILEKYKDNYKNLPITLYTPDLPHAWWIEDWCDKKFGKNNHRFTAFGYRSFRNKSDAMLFKLRWYGRWNQR